MSTATTPARNQASDLDPLSAVDQVVEAIEADYWDQDRARAGAAIAAFDDEATALLGRLFRHWATEDSDEEFCGCTGPYGSLLEMVACYRQSGDDPETAARFRDALSDDLHREQLRRMDIEEVLHLMDEGNMDFARKVAREYGLPSPEELKGGAQ